MADFRLRIPREHMPMFRRFVELDSDEFETLTADIESMTPTPTAEAFREALQAKGRDEATADWITSFLLSLSSLKASTDEPFEDVFASLAKDLERQKPEWWDESRWNEKQEMLARLIAAESPVSLLGKAALISSQGSGTVIRTRIFTDTRWVFSESADTVLGAVTRHVLNISSVDGLGNDATHSFVLDDEDLKKLGFQIERAMVKSATIASLTETTKTPTLHP